MLSVMKTAKINTLENFPLQYLQWSCATMISNYQGLREIYSYSWPHPRGHFQVRAKLGMSIYVDVDITQYKITTIAQVTSVC